MEFTVKKSDLVKELSLGQGVVEKKTTIPVLANVLLEARDDELALTVTDLELGIQTSCPAVVKKPGATTVPARKLLDYVRLLPDAELAVKVGENDAINIVCGRSRTRIAGMARENFPELAKMPAALTQIPAKLLVKLMSRTIFAVANEEARYTLIGALMIVKENALVLVATDGHRLAYASDPQEFPGISDQVRGLVPKKAMAELLKLVAEGGDSMVVDFAMDENHLFFRCGHRLLSARKLVGQFPDFERVLPADNNIVLTMNTEEVMAAIRRVSQFADDRSRAIRLEIHEGELRLASSGSDAGESEETVPVTYDGKKIKVGFNSQYLLDFLGAVGSEEVEMQFKDDESAGQLTTPQSDGGDYRYVVMPMRI